jgi:hypothetical protein
MESVSSILNCFSNWPVGYISMASQVNFVQTRAQMEQPIHSLNRIWTGGIGILYFPAGTVSMQSTGQKGTHAWQPVQLSSSTTATNLGFFFLAVILVGRFGTNL